MVMSAVRQSAGKASTNARELGPARWIVCTSAARKGTSSTNAASSHGASVASDRKARAIVPHLPERAPLGLAIGR